MSKCKNCGKEAPLYSINIPGEVVGHAVCETCGDICTKCSQQKKNCRCVKRN